jgi:hypothetical protein
MSAKQSDGDKAAEEAVVNKLRAGVAMTDLSEDEIAAFKRVNDRQMVVDAPAPATKPDSPKQD